MFENKTKSCNIVCAMRGSVPQTAGELAKLATVRSRAHVPRRLCAPFGLPVKTAGTRYAPTTVGRLGHSPRRAGSKASTRIMVAVQFFAGFIVPIWLHRK